MQGKTKLATISIMTIIALFITVGARNATSGVSGGKHDMAGAGWGVSNFKFGSAEGVDQPCVFCHTPHGANFNQTYSTNPTLPAATGGTLAGQYLWNRMLPSRAFTPYTSPTFDHTSGLGGTPGVTSLLCLSCHDGVGAMNVLLNYGGVATALSIDSGTENQFGDFGIPGGGAGWMANIGDADCTGGGGDTCTGGVNLQNDHPIGFQYDHTQDSGLKPKTGMNAVLKDRLTFLGDRMECSTCHDPHLDNPGGNMFLVMSNAGSALCLECHNK